MRASWKARRGHEERVGGYEARLGVLDLWWGAGRGREGVCDLIRVCYVSYAVNVFCERAGRGGGNALSFETLASYTNYKTYSLPR